MKTSSGPAVTVGMAVAYALAVLHVLPRLSFFPHLGRWSFGAIEGEPAITWYGYVGWALLGGLVAGVFSRAVGLKTPWRLAFLVPLVILAGLFWGQRRWFGF
jgi:hypothetical protein